MSRPITEGAGSCAHSHTAPHTATHTAPHTDCESYLYSATLCVHRAPKLASPVMAPHMLRYAVEPRMSHVRERARSCSGDRQPASYIYTMGYFSIMIHVIHACVCVILCVSYCVYHTCACAARAAAVRVDDSTGGK